MNISWARLVVASMGASGVAAAAFYAHGLDKITSAAQMHNWAIGCAMQLVTVPAILAALSRSSNQPAGLGWSARLMSLGVLFFSGTLYLMALGFPRWLGAVTPLGGLLLMLGWLLVAVEEA